MRRDTWRWAVLACACATLAACGGGGKSAPVPPPAGTPGVATIGPAGGTVATDDGASVTFPPDALTGDVSVRISKDGTGAPPLPPVAAAAGAVYAITPHGGDFATHVEVAIPVEQTAFAANEQLVLVTAEPGEPGWRVLSNATFSSGKLHAPVMQFSFFQAVVLRDVLVPQLVTSVDNKNNLGLDGATQIAPGQVLDPSSAWNVVTTWRPEFVARLRFPAGRLSTGGTGGVPLRACLPASSDSTGAAFRFMRDGAIWSAPVRSGLMLYTAASYPRTEREFDWRYLQKSLTRASAYHFYGQDTPRIGGFGTESVALPPANNVLDDDVMTWRGVVALTASDNGLHRVDVTVPTDCGLFLEAVPLSFRLNLPPAGRDPFSGFQPATPVVSVARGANRQLLFYAYGTGLLDSFRLEASRSLVDWEGRQVPAGPLVSSQLSSSHEARYYEATLQDVQPAAAGFYRARGCDAQNRCLLGDAFELRVYQDQPVFLQQPAGSWVARVGDRLAWRVRVATGLLPTVRWQRRSVLEAVFGVDAWHEVSSTEATVTQNLEQTEVEAVLPLQATLADHGMQYRAVLDTPSWGLVSDPALLTVVEEFSAPQLVAQPASQTVVVGSTAVFVVTVSGTPPFSYQWRRNGVAIPGANAPTLTLNDVTGAQAGSYTLVVTNRGGSVTSDAATLVVALGVPAELLPPQITAAPASLTVTEGNAASFAVSVSGTGPYTYAWRKDGTPIPGATGASFSLPATVPEDAGAYSVRVTNAQGFADSAGAALTVTPRPVTPQPLPPTLVTPPVGLAVLPGAGATFAVAVTGTAPFTFQWRRDGEGLAGATGPVLHLPSVTGSDAGQYTVEVRNAVGSAASTAVPLIVIGAPGITVQPLSTSVLLGATASFAVTAVGPSLRYQWLRDGVAIPGATGASYTTAPLALSDSGALFSVLVYNGAGHVFSASAVLTVSEVPSAFPPGSVPLRATHAVSGQELWMTDGTADGTVLVRDIFPGEGNSSPGEFTRLGGWVLFAARDDVSGQELWRTDGTPAGTVRVADLNPAGSSFPENLVACNGLLFFSASDASSHGLYRSDGTAEGTTRLLDVRPGSGQRRAACVGGIYYFSGDTQATGEELWRSDGTPGGTSLVADLVPGTGGSSPSELTEFLGQLVFKAANTLWRTDGTAPGTTQLSTEALDPTWLLAHGSTLYFSANSGAAGREPWRSDGTPGGTGMIADLVPGNGSFSSYPYKFTASGGVTYFAAQPFLNGPQQLWRTDGTAGGTVNLTPSLGQVASFGDSILDVDGSLYFSASAGGTNVELWKSDGTAGGTVLVRDIAATGGSYPAGFFRLGSALYFSATGPEGAELWRSDGTAGGTALVKDLCTPGCSGNPQPR